MAGHDGERPASFGGGSARLAERTASPPTTLKEPAA